MKKIIILDFNSGKVHIYRYPAKKGKGITKFYKTPEEYLQENTDHQISNCDWMVCEDDMKINIH